MLKIGGAAIKTPKSFKVDILDLDGETSRNAKGEMIRDRIAVKRKLDCEWAPLKMEEISTILQAVQSVYFQVEYPDPLAGSMQTKTFYVGNRSTPMYRKDQSGQITWQGLTLSFIEK